MSHRNSKIQGWASNASDDTGSTNQQQGDDQQPNNIHSTTSIPIQTDTAISSHTNFFFKLWKVNNVQQKKTLLRTIGFDT